MATLVAKWGHSLAVRLPKQLTTQAGIGAGDRVEITAGQDGTLTITPVRAKYRLEDLTRRITADNRHDEADWGGPRGEEVW